MCYWCINECVKHIAGLNILLSSVKMYQRLSECWTKNKVSTHLAEIYGKLSLTDAA